MKKIKPYLAILILLNSIVLIGQTESDVEIDSSAVVCSIPLKAKFPGGQDSLSIFLVKNLKWPSPDFCGEGRVIVSFIVEQSGEITNKEVVKSLCNLCDKEAMRVVNLMPNWIPPNKNGKPIKSKMFFPINFKLQ